MSIRLIRLSRSLALSLFVALALSCGGGGGSQFDDVCADYTDAILDCLDANTSDARLISRAECVDDMEESDDLDGDECVRAQIAAYECLQIETCEYLSDFLGLRWNEVFIPATGAPGPPLDYCDTEIRLAVDVCPLSIVLPGDPTDI